MAVDRLIAAFREDCEIRGLAPVTINVYINSLNILHRFFNKPLIEVTKDDIRRWVADCRKRELKAKTISNHLTTLSSFYEFCKFEEIIQSNPIEGSRKRFQPGYKIDGEQSKRKLITIEEAKRLLGCASDIRDKCVLMILLKTMVRENELRNIDISDINWKDQSVLLKPTKKRSNRKVFFDDEAAYVLKRWLKVRESRKNNGTDALFLSNKGDRLGVQGIAGIVHKIGLLARVHDPSSDRLEDHLVPHGFRDFGTTYLLRAGMHERYIGWLRGDKMTGSMGPYIHIDPEDVRRSYLACIPSLLS